MDWPTITITFVAWMRRDMLQVGIESALAQNYERIEIIVVDNSPTDEIYLWLCEFYPKVKSIKTFAPLPLPLVRNMMVKTARGKYVVFQDDDSYFNNVDGLLPSVQYLEENEDVACLAFRQGNERGEWNPLYDGRSIRKTYNYIACAVMFRRADYIKAGGYFDQFSLYGEELILSLGFFGIGKEIHYCPYVEIIHHQVMRGRNNDPARRYHIADIIMTPGALLLKCPLPDVLIWYPANLLIAAVRVAIAKRRPIVALQGLIGAVLWAPRFLIARKPITRSNFRRWLSVRLDSRAAQRKRYLL